MTRIFSLFILALSPFLLFSKDYPTTKQHVEEILKKSNFVAYVKKLDGTLSYPEYDMALSLRGDMLSQEEKYDAWKLKSGGYLKDKYLVIHNFVNNSVYGHTITSDVPMMLTSPIDRGGFAIVFFEVSENSEGEQTFSFEYCSLIFAEQSELSFMLNLNKTQLIEYVLKNDLHYCDLLRESE